MLIRLGYEIAHRMPAANAHSSRCSKSIGDRQPDIQRQTRVLTSPSHTDHRLHDRYGNACRRFVAPEGSFRILYDAVIEDTGQPDEVEHAGARDAGRGVADDALGYLLGSRYCETDHLGGLAWTLFGNMPPGWARVQAIVDYVHNRLSFGYGYARPTRTAAQAHEERRRRLPRLRASRHHALPLHEHSGALREPAISATSACRHDPAPMDFSAWFGSLPGWQAGIRSTRATTSRASGVS